MISDKEGHYSFSIIIPHKNTPDLLMRCIDSIPKRDDIQIVIVDDKSDEGVVDFVKFPGLQDENIDVVFTKEGRGAGYARNIGLNYAKGEWLIFADSDDFFSEELDDILTNSKESEADLIFFNVDSVNSDNIKVKTNRGEYHTKLFHVFKENPKIGETLFRLNYNEPWGKMIKKTLVDLNNLKFDEVIVANDYFFSTQVGCLAKRVQILDKVLYIVTLREGSLSYSFADSITKITVRINVAIRVQKYVRTFGYVHTPMPLRGLMVLLLKKDFILFFKYLIIIQREGISVVKLLSQIFNPKFFKR